MVTPRQFEVFANPGPKNVKARPYLIVLQHDLFADYKTHLVAPLVAKGHLQPVPRLNPEFGVGGTIVYLSPMEIAVWPAHILRDPVANLFPARDVIIAALDLVFTGV